MREFAGIAERLARLEVNLTNLASSVSGKSSEFELTSLSKRVQDFETDVTEVKRDVANIKNMLAQYRGAFVVLGVIWPLVADWVKKILLGGI